MPVTSMLCGAPAGIAPGATPLGYIIALDGIAGPIAPGGIIGPIIFSRAATLGS